jgi:photosystem II stability/assembly factor-like uncharacterized protein
LLHILVLYCFPFFSRLLLLFSPSSASPPQPASGTFVWTAHGVASHQEIHQWNEPTIITSSSDGSHLAAVATVGDIYTSTDGGATWTNDTVGTSLSGLLWQSITSSSDGAKLAAVATVGDIYTSTDGGATWTDDTTGTDLSGLYWFSITSSSNGMDLAAVTDGGDIYTSTDGGAMWTNDTTGTGLSGLNWQSITS